MSPASGDVHLVPSRTKPSSETAARPRASRWEWAQAGLLAVNLGWTTLCLGGLRAETMVVTLALTVVLLAVHGLARAWEAGAPPLHPAGFWLLPFLGYAGANVLWVTPAPWLGWLDWLGWAQLIAVFWVVLNGVRSRGPRQLLFLTLCALGLVAVLMTCYQRSVNPKWLMLGRGQAMAFGGQASGPFGIPNSLAGFFLLLLPATGLLAFRSGASAAQRIWWGWLTAVFGLGLVLTVSRGAWLALGLALVAWALLARGQTWKKRLALAVAVLAGLLLAGVALGRFSAGARERFGRLIADRGEVTRPAIWQGAWQLFQDRPVLGTGAGSFNVLFERHRPAGFRDEPVWAHNEYLNTLSDYGAVGFGLLFGALGAIAWRAWREHATAESRRRDWLGVLGSTGALGIGLLAFAVQLLVDFHFRMPALVLGFATLLALASRPRAGNALDSTPEVGMPGPKVRWNWLALTGAAAIAIWPIARIHRAEALRVEAREAIDAKTRKREALGDVPSVAEAGLRRATALNPRNGNAWGDLAYAIELQGFLTPARAGELAKLAEEAARKAVACSPVMAEFWIRLGVSLDTQRRAGEAQAAFATAVKLAPRSYRTWYYYAYHLSLDPKRVSEAKEAIANCLALDPGNREAESLREQLNGRS